MFHRLIRLILAIPLVVAIALASAGSAYAQEPVTASPQERAAASVRPAVVYLHMQWQAWLLWNSNNSVLRGAGEGYTVDVRCSGFVINPKGYIATAGHCVDPAEAANDVIRHQAGVWAQARPDLGTPTEWIEYAFANLHAEGRETGSKPDLTVTAEVVTGGGQAPVVLPARLLDFRSFDQGDTALLKAEGDDMASVLLAPEADVQVGTPVVSIGFPGVTDVATPNATGSAAEPTNKDGTISAAKNVGKVGYPAYELSATVLPGMSGGPTVGLDGRVIGVNSFHVDDDTQSANFVASVALLTEMLNRNGVKNELGPVDEAYRSGLANFYAGHYSAAIEDFDRVLLLSPRQAQAAQFKTRAFKNRELYGDAGLPVWVLVTIGVGVLGGAAAIVLVVRRRRSTVDDAGVPTTSTDTADSPVAAVVGQAGWFCLECGTPGAATARFCGSCGTATPQGEDGPLIPTPRGADHDVLRVSANGTRRDQSVT